MQWSNPSMQFPLPEALTQALKYLRALLFSKDSAHWLSLCRKPAWTHGLDYSIAPPMDNHDKPRLGFPHGQTLPTCAVERVTKQLYIYFFV